MNKWMMTPLLAVAVMGVFGCKSEPMVMKATSHPAMSASQVKVYTEPPKKYELLGQVEVTDGLDFGPETSIEGVVERLQTEAGNKGANGLLLRSDASPDADVAQVLGRLGDASVKLPVRLKPSKAALGQAIYVVQEYKK